MDRLWKGALTAVKSHTSSLRGIAAAREVTELKRVERTMVQKNVEREHASRIECEFLANTTNAAHLAQSPQAAEAAQLARS